MIPASRTAKNWIRGWVRWSRRSYARTFLSYGPRDLRAALERVGIRAGDQLMLHAGFDERYGFTGGANDVIETFLEVLGAEGGLYMVSLPFTGSTAEYLQSKPVLDIRRTASKMGLVSEFFRRRPGTQRSLHPTHPVLGVGPQAARILQGHELCDTGCGAGSPFEHLLQCDGKAAFYDVSPATSMTYVHYLEDLLAPRLPFALYEAQPMEASLVDAQGRKLEMSVRVYSPSLAGRRRTELLYRWMDEARIVKRTKVGGTTIAAINLKDITELVMEKACQEQFFFDMAQ